ncbi:MAG: nitroreductase family deazaflavin-dependent oxidoreductase [Chloroflexi bacterium]|nr:MAG: nitroreductase family deazaflavin-dependent oxidoreductase [Chloroflexota bacterium]
MLAEERPKLVDRHKEGDQVDDAERAFEDETGQPVIGCREPVHGGGYATRAVDPAGSTTRALAEADDLELVTTGRVTGRPHSVRLRFAYEDGVVWLRTGERPSAPDARGVRRRTKAERETDWFRNLEHDPHARVRIADAELPAVYEPSADPAADLRRSVELLRLKYGAEWVADWYLEIGRIPVKLRLVPEHSFEEGRQW